MTIGIGRVLNLLDAIVVERGFISIGGRPQGDGRGEQSVHPVGRREPDLQLVGETGIFRARDRHDVTVGVRIAARYPNVAVENDHDVRVHAVGGGRIGARDRPANGRANCRVRDR